jgi:hypothetical protein
MSGTNTITSANSVYTLSIDGLYPVPQQLQGYAADGSFATETVDIAETRMGVDGLMSAGWLPRMTPQTITLQADSISIDLFENWSSAQDVVREIYWASGLISMPSIGKKYTMTRGVLTKYQAVADNKKVLDPRTFTITWGSIQPAPF